MDAIPEDADAVMIYGPNSDISGEEERDVLKEYVKGGGKLLVMAGPTEEGLLENLYGILSEYGIRSMKVLWWKVTGSIMRSGLLICCFPVWKAMKLRIP